MPPAIQVLAEKLEMARGADYFISRNALSHYVHQLSDLEFEQEILMVDNHQIFDLLWSVGLSLQRQAIVLARDRELNR